MSDQTNAPTTGADNSLAVANQAYSEAQRQYEQVLSEIGNAENRVRDLQTQAEEAQLLVVEAEANVRGVQNGLKVLVEEEHQTQVALQEALAILQEAKKLVAENEEKARAAEERRIEKERELFPFYAQLGEAKTSYQRFLSLATAEGARLKRVIASAEEEVSMSQAAMYEAKLQLLKSPELNDLSGLKALIGE